MVPKSWQLLNGEGVNFLGRGRSFGSPFKVNYSPKRLGNQQKYSMQVEGFIQAHSWLWIWSSESFCPFFNNCQIQRRAVVVDSAPPNALTITFQHWQLHLELCDSSHYWPIKEYDTCQKLCGTQRRSCSSVETTRKCFVYLFIYLFMAALGLRCCPGFL